MKLFTLLFKFLIEIILNQKIFNLLPHLQNFSHSVNGDLIFNILPLNIASDPDQYYYTKTSKAMVK